MTPAFLSERPSPRVREIANRLVAAVSDDWSLLTFDVGIVGTFSEFRLRVTTATGAELWRQVDGAIVKLTRTLREETSTATTGAWFTFQLTIDRANFVAPSFRFTEDPPFRAKLSALQFQLDLARYPREPSAVPSWLRRVLDEAAAIRASEPTKYERLAYKGNVVTPATIQHWVVDYRSHTVSVTTDGREWPGTGFDAFAALADAREQLDRESIRLGVEGARYRSYPSGMPRDEGDGLFVYRLELAQRAAEDDRRKTFDAVEDGMLATVHAQKLFYERWLASHGHEALTSIVGPVFTVIGSATDGYSVGDLGGGIRYALSRSSETTNWTVTRAERAENPYFTFEAAEFEDVRRYLVMEMGVDIRLRLHLAMLFPDSETAAPGFSVENREGRDHLLEGRAVRAIFAAGGVGRRSANEFSWLAGHPVEELLASYQAPDGMPLLAKFVRRTP